LIAIRSSSCSLRLLDLSSELDLWLFRLLPAHLREPERTIHKKLVN